MLQPDSPRLAVPCIETESVYAALEAMRSGRPLNTTHPLHQFLSIHQHSVSLTGGAAADVRIFARISKIIRQRLKLHRERNGIEVVSSTNHLAHVEADFRLGSEELQAWSLLYFRYVRADFSYSLAELEPIVAHTERTLQRRQQLGIQRLTQVLTTRELALRAKQRSALLRAQLPSAMAPRLLGREDLLTTILDQLLHGADRHLLLLGEPGIGTTTLAHAVALRLIEQPTITHVAWVDYAQMEAENLFAHLAQTLDLSPALEPRMALRIHLHRANTLIVFDQAQALLNSPHRLKSILDTVGDAILIFCSYTPDFSLPDLPTCYVPELTLEASIQLLEALARNAADQSSQSSGLAYFVDLIARFGGNPGLLKAAYASDQPYSVASGPLQVWQQRWQAVSHEAQLLWVVASMWPTPTIDLATAQTLLAHASHRPVLRELLACYAVEPRQLPTIKFTAPARTAAQQLLREPHAVPSVLLEDAVRFVTDHILAAPQRESLAHWLDQLAVLPLSDSLRADLMYALNDHVTYWGCWARWAQLLTTWRGYSRGEDRKWILLALGRAHRQRGQWEASVDALNEAYLQAELEGDHHLQASANLELATTLLLRGNTTVALQLVQLARATFHPLGRLADLEACDLEAVWIALQRGEHTRAAELLTTFPLDLPEAQLALAHLALKHEDLPLAFERVDQLRGQLSVDDPLFPSVVALLGQIYYAGNQWEPALDAMLYAIRAFEQREALVGWSRTCYNLALMYAERGDLTHALQYLRSLPHEYHAE